MWLAGRYPSLSGSGDARQPTTTRRRIRKIDRSMRGIAGTRLAIRTRSAGKDRSGTGGSAVSPPIVYVSQMCIRGRLRNAGGVRDVRAFGGHFNSCRLNARVCENLEIVSRAPTVIGSQGGAQVSRSLSLQRPVQRALCTDGSARGCVNNVPRP